VFKIPPADINFTIGKSDASKDWYYAQTKQGSWKINFEVTKPYNDTATLIIAIAGYARNPVLEILVNETNVVRIRAGNDVSVYRSAIAGGYYQLKKIKFPAALLKQGNNTISFNLSSVKEGAGVMYDAIKLEVK
jgi:rhamnogalacturonan endolyase